jgi:hypothetical protein
MACQYEAEDDAAQAALELRLAFQQWANLRCVVGFPRLCALERYFRIWRATWLGRRFYARQRLVLQEIFHKWSCFLVFQRRR